MSVVSRFAAFLIIVLLSAGLNAGPGWAVPSDAHVDVAPGLLAEAPPRSAERSAGIGAGADAADAGLGAAGWATDLPIRASAALAPQTGAIRAGRSVLDSNRARAPPA